jgi:hypothetical protein
VFDMEVSLNFTSHTVREASLEPGPEQESGC